MAYLDNDAYTQFTTTHAIEHIQTVADHLAFDDINEYEEEKVAELKRAAEYLLEVINDRASVAQALVDAYKDTNTYDPTNPTVKMLELRAAALKDA